jgi:hypothetical protein
MIRKPTNAHKCIIHTVYLLRVSATHVANFREVHYKGYKNITISMYVSSVMHLSEDGHMSGRNM